MHLVSMTSSPTLPSERQPGFNGKHCHSGNMTRESIATSRGLAPQRERSWRLYHLIVSNGLRPHRCVGRTFVLKIVARGSLRLLARILVHCSVGSAAGLRGWSHVRSGPLHALQAATCGYGVCDPVCVYGASSAPIFVCRQVSGFLKVQRSH